MIQILKDKQSMYTINTSLHELPVVISLPHSGTYITSEMAENLMDDVIFPNTDWYLPKLYGFLKELGFTIIINNMKINNELFGETSRRMENVFIELKKWLKDE